MTVPLCAAGVCTFEAVTQLNWLVVRPLLAQLVKTPFFRYFKARPRTREDMLLPGLLAFGVHPCRSGLNICGVLP